MNILVKLPPASPMPFVPGPPPVSQFLEEDAFPAGTSPTTRPKSRGNQLEETVCLEQLKVEGAVTALQTQLLSPTGANAIEMRRKINLLGMVLL